MLPSSFSYHHLHLNLKKQDFETVSNLIKVANSIADINIMTPFTEVSTSPLQENLKEPHKTVKLKV